MELKKYIENLKSNYQIISYWSDIYFNSERTETDSYIFFKNVSFLNIFNSPAAAAGGVPGVKDLMLSDIISTGYYLNMSTTVEETVKYLDLKNKDIDLKAKILDLLKKLYSRTSEKGELLSMIYDPGNISADEILLFLLKASKSENIDNYIRTQNPKILKIQMMNERQYNFIKNPYQDTEGTYMCPKCKGFKTYTQTKQTRSADEGSTTFVICLGCGTSSKL